MNFADSYYRFINWPGRTAELVTLGTAVALLIMAAVILSMGRLRRFARVLGIVGVVIITALLWIVREQTVTRKPSAHITVRAHRYSERTRLALLVGLVTLPVLSTVVMSSVFVSTRRRLRARS